MSFQQSRQNGGIADALLTAEELARRLQVTTGTVYRLVKENGLPGVRVGGQWRFRREDFEHWLGGQHRDA